MNSTDSFSAKKKKDLVAIAVHFGLLTESKANSMSKQNLIDFFLEQERIGSSGNTELKTGKPEAKRTDRSERRKAANDRSVETKEDPGSEDSLHEPVPEQMHQQPPEQTEDKVIPESSAPQAPEKRTRPSSRRKSSNQIETTGQESTESRETYREQETDFPAEGDFENIEIPAGRSSEEYGESLDGSLIDESEPLMTEIEATPAVMKKSTRSRKRSIIIKPKKDSGLPTDDDFPIEDDLDGVKSGEEEPDQEDAAKIRHGGSHRTLRHKEPENETITGILEIMPEGFGFIRRENYLPSASDIFVHSNYIRRFGLRTGDCVTGPVRPKKESDKYAPIQYIKEVNDLPPEKMQRRPHFDRLTPIYPDEKFVLETEKTELSTRIIDLIAPIGKGQRGMIVSPPKAGKTILLQKIANAISTNNPDAKLIVLLIDERPEEVTDMQRSINGEVVYSTFDKKPENHTKIVELVLERAMRLVELENDVVILLDSMTRLSRAYNLTINPTGRTLSGGLDPGALYGPKRLFGAARNIENGGSLTIIATSLIETGSRMDEVIFEEFKGTGNMEVYLDRKLSEKRIFPAIDINKSSTRHEELLLGTTDLDAVWTIRKAFSQLDTSTVTEMIISLLLKTQTNQQFIQSVNVSFNDKAVFEAMRGTRPAGTSTVSNGNTNGK